MILIMRYNSVVFHVTSLQTFKHISGSIEASKILLYAFLCKKYIPDNFLEHGKAVASIFTEIIGFPRYKFSIFKWICPYIYEEADSLRVNKTCMYVYLHHEKGQLDVQNEIRYSFYAYAY